MAFWVSLDEELEKNYFDIWNQHPRICRNAKKSAKQKKIEFGTKMQYLGIFGCKFEKVLSYLKSTSSNLSKCKVSCKIKNPCFWYHKCLI